MSLVDSIYKANEEPESRPVSENERLLKYLVDEAIRESETQRWDEFSIYQLHVEDGKLYYGHSEVAETEKNMYRLTRSLEKIPSHLMPIFWDRLKRRLPVLDKSVIQISDNLFWDKDKGEILNKEQIYEKYFPQEEDIMGYEEEGQPSGCEEGD